MKIFISVFLTIKKVNSLDDTKRAYLTFIFSKKKYLIKQSESFIIKSRVPGFGHAKDHLSPPPMLHFHWFLTVENFLDPKKIMVIY